MESVKLELRHLAGYLPYGLKIVCLGEVFTLHYYLDALYFSDDFEHISLENMFKELGNKPILRPLSDLTKDENFELCVDLCDELGLVRCEHLLLALQDNLRYAFNLQDLNTLEEWMYKNHFDWKYSLIKKGLAIDINTLDK